MGELVTTHGLRGWLKLHPYNPQTTAFSSVQKVYLQKGSGSLASSVEGCKAFSGDFLLKLGGIDSIDAAEPWVGSVVAIDESDLKPLQAGEYYYHQILGLDVFDLHDQWLGKVERVWAKAGGDLYVVKGAGKEYLIPVASEIIEKVDLAQRKIIINPPPGLLSL